MDDPFDPWPENWRSIAATNTDFYRNVWNSWQAAVILWIAALGACVWFWFHPSTGAAIAVLGAIAAAMSIRDIGPREKFFWLVVVFGLLFVELRSIRRDDEDRKDTRTKEMQNFQTIADGIKTSINNGQQQFEATMSQFGYVLTKTNAVALLAAKGLENITGGPSFAFVVPQAFGSEEVPLMIWNHGDQVLSGVTVTIANTTNDPNWGSAFYRPVFIGTIGPQGNAPLPLTIRPRPDPKSGQDSYWIMISAQNGTVSQSLWFRANKKNNGVPWAYSYLVTKSVTIKQAQGEIPKGATMMKPILYREWSDEVDAPH
jgi:hypothetical protein